MHYNIASENFILAELFEIKLLVIKKQLNKEKKFGLLYSVKLSSIFFHYNIFLAVFVFHCSYLKRTYPIFIYI